jgi:ADP-ribose pyrophosphatase YjhB (NUDIX family)
MEDHQGEAAPEPRALLPLAFAVVRNSGGQVLLVRRAEGAYWELPGGRVEIGESASATVVRQVAEQAGIAIDVTGLAGLYSDPGQVLVCPQGEGSYQLFAVCFYASTAVREARPDPHGTTAAAWFDPGRLAQLDLHPAMRQRLTDALLEPQRAHFD